MAFQLTYHRIVDGGLTHTYSTQYGHDKGRVNKDYQGLLQLQRMREAQQLKTQVILRKAAQQDGEEGDWQSKRQLPPGPSFKFLSRQEIDEIVNRVGKPTVASRGIERDSEIRCMTARRQSSPRFTGFCSARTYGGLPPINDRLVEPTHMTNVRAKRDVEQIINYNGKIHSESMVTGKTG